MLSAVIARLRTIQTEKDTQEQHRILGFCVNAYPDIRPWQVRNVTFQSEKDTGRPGLYYEYLTKLLHPEEGDDRARQDAELVKVRDWMDDAPFSFLLGACVCTCACLSCPCRAIPSLTGSQSHVVVLPAFLYSVSRLMLAQTVKRNGVGCRYSSLSCPTMTTTKTRTVYGSTVSSKSPRGGTRNTSCTSVIWCF